MAEFRASLMPLELSMTRAILVAGAVALLLVATVEPGRAQTVTRDAAACAALARLQIPGLDLTVTSAQWRPAVPPAAPPATRATAATPPSAAAAALPAHCRLDGMLDRRTGRDGKGYGIGFAIALPAEWNGRLLQMGGGGLNGSVAAPTGPVAAGESPALARGFAVISTDTGHSGAVFDGSFMQDQQAALDFLYQAVGRVTPLGRQIVAQYYAQPVSKAYFTGCSTGGREAMLMAQRYPALFDGIVAGAPAMRTAYSGIGDAWVATMLNTVAPTDANGRPQVRQALSDGDRQAVIKGIVNACDAGDGLADGMIFNTRSCRFDPKTLVCSGAKADGCLSSAQASAIETAFAGPKDSKGRQVYPGFLFDTGLAATQGIAGLLLGGQSPTGAAFTDTTMDVDARAAAAAADVNMLGATANWTNLSTFASRGGKLVFFHGVSDPWFSALDTIDYYERLGQANGGAAQVADWSRLFLAPGMGHCRGGDAALDSFDLLSAVVDWVEKGTPPDAVPASGRAFPGRARPLWAYPRHAHYSGRGDREVAASFVCQP
jgi:feruloyl esterase